MTPAFVLSLIAVGITGAGILVQLGRVLSKLEELGASNAEVRKDQRELRDSLDRLRHEAALAQRDHDHLVEHVDTVSGHLARLESRVDATPHHGTPALKPR